MTEKYEKMKKAYICSAKMIQRKMSKEREGDFNALRQISDNEIIIIEGKYDQIQDIFDMLNIPYKLISMESLQDIELDPTQTLIINSTETKFAYKNMIKIKKFIEDGGFLWTTDWLLMNLIQIILPQYIKYSGRPTLEDIVEVEIAKNAGSYINGLNNENFNPQWWLEHNSYPIQVLNSEKVKVLVQSEDMNVKYGSSAIVVLFNHEKGTVLHMITHYYLQRTELKTDRHNKSAKEFALKEMKLSPDDIADIEFEGVSLGEIESAYTSTQLMVNAIVERKKKLVKIKNEIVMEISESSVM